MSTPSAPSPSFATIRLDVADRIGTLLIDRPDSRNALTDQVCIELSQALEFVERSNDIGVVVLRGAGPVFCAGGDRKEPSELQSPDRATRIRMARRWDELYDRLDRLQQPTVARLTGAAIGGGALLALACDLRVADSSVVLRFPEVAMGQYLLAAGTARIVGEAGPARARDLLLTGRSLDAATAEQWGLLNRVVDAGDLDATVDEICATLIGIRPGVASLTRQSVRAATAGRSSGWADAFLGTVE